MKGSAAPPRCSRQETFGCLVDASSRSPSGKDSAARQHRHKKPRYVLDSSQTDLSRLSGPFLPAPLPRLAIPACVRIACHLRETRCCDDARRLARLTMQRALMDSPLNALQECPLMLPPEVQPWPAPTTLPRATMRPCLRPRSAVIPKSTVYMYMYMCMYSTPRVTPKYCNDS